MANKGLFVSSTPSEEASQTRTNLLDQLGDRDEDGELLPLNTKTSDIANAFIERADDEAGDADTIVIKQSGKPSVTPKPTPKPKAQPTPKPGEVRDSTKEEGHPGDTIALQDDDSIMLQTTSNPATGGETKRSGQKSRSTTKTPAATELTKRPTPIAEKMAERIAQDQALKCQVPKHQAPKGLMSPPSPPPHKTGSLSEKAIKDNSSKRKAEKVDAERESKERESSVKKPAYTQIAKLNRNTIKLYDPVRGPGPEVTVSRVPKNYEDAGGPFSEWSLYNDFKRIEKKNEATWPPSNVLLQDWHVAKVMSTIPAKKRFGNWPADFDTLGYPRTIRRNKGRAAKEQDAEDGLLYYQSIGGHYVLCGDEGTARVAKLAGDAYQKSMFGPSKGPRCVIQDDFVPSNQELLTGIYPSRYSEFHEAKKLKVSHGNEHESVDEAPQASAAAASPPISSKKPQKAKKQRPGVAPTANTSTTSKGTPPNKPQLPGPPVSSVPRVGEAEAEPDSPVPSIEGDTFSDAGPTPTTPAKAKGLQPGSKLSASTTTNEKTGTGTSFPRRTPGSFSARKTILPLKFAARAPQPAKPDFTPFYAREIAILLHQNREATSWVNHSLEAIVEAITTATDELDLDTAGKIMTNTCQYALSLYGDLEERHDASLVALYRRGTEGKVDMEAVKANLVQLQERFPDRDYEGGVEEPPMPPPLRIPVDTGEIKDAGQDTIADGLADPFVSPKGSKTKAEVEDSPKTIVGDRPKYATPAVAQQALFRLEDRMDTGDGRFDGTGGNPSGSTGAGQCAQQ